MATQRRDNGTGKEEEGVLENPWPWLLAGLAASLMVLIIGRYWDAGWPVVDPPLEGFRALLLAAGLLAAGWAVVQRPRSAPVLGAAALVAFIAFHAAAIWDSAQLMILVLTIIATVAAFLYLPDFIDENLGHDPNVALAARIAAIGAFSLITAIFIANSVFSQTFVFPSPRDPNQAVSIELANPKPYLFAVLAWAVCTLLYGLLYWDPPVMRKVIVSILILVHFGGIVTAISSVPPPNSPMPWLPNQLWTRFYRPYLQFMYLNNAYHFYSPEPGPATLIWARIEYSDGSCRWIKVPNKDEHFKDPFGQSYYRLLALTDRLNYSENLQAVPPLRWESRVAAGQQYRIPPHLEVPQVLQYRIPNMDARRLLVDYVKHLVHAFPHDDPTVAVKEVKVYKVIHQMLQPAEMVQDDRTPVSKVLFHPYYLGTYDSEGRLLSPNRDPFLYWLIPILPVLQDQAGPTNNTDQPFQLRLPSEPVKPELVGIVDCLTRHAGMTPDGQVFPTGCPWPLLTGRVKAVAPDFRELVVVTDAGEEKQVFVESSASVRLNGQDTNRNNLQPGVRVSLSFEERKGQTWVSDVWIEQKPNGTGS